MSARNSSSCSAAARLIRSSALGKLGLELNSTMRRSASIRQSKTGTEIEIPLHPVLRASLEALPKKNMTFLLTEYGKPFTVDGFGNWFRDRVREAELPDRGNSPHGLRKAACRRLAEAGCTGPQIMAISGHKNLKEVQTYIQAAERLGLAREALKRQLAADEERTKIVKPDRQV